MGASAFDDIAGLCKSGADVLGSVEAAMRASDTDFALQSLDQISIGSALVLGGAAVSLRVPRLGVAAIYGGAVLTSRGAIGMALWATDRIGPRIDGNYRPFHRSPEAKGTAESVGIDAVQDKAVDVASHGTKAPSLPSREKIAAARHILQACADRFTPKQTGMTCAPDGGSCIANVPAESEKSPQRSQELRFDWLGRLERGVQASPGSVNQRSPESSLVHSIAPRNSDHADKSKGDDKGNDRAGGPGRKGGP